MSVTNTSHPTVSQNFDSFSDHALPRVSSTLNQVGDAAQGALKNIKSVGISVFNQVKTKVLNTSLSPIIRKVNAICHDSEKILNIAGSTPWIGFLSGNIRSVLGYAQIIAGIALTALSELGLIIASFSKDSEKLVSQWKILSKTGIEFTVHGCLNFIRGTGEALLSSFTFGLGNVVLLLPNLAFERNFAPYFAYGTLTGESATAQDAEDSSIAQEIEKTS